MNRFVVRHRTLVIVFLVALIVRGGVNLGSVANYDSDPDAYRTLAETIASTGTFGLVGTDRRPRPTAFRPPLYPWLLSWLVFEGRVSNIAVAVSHAILGALTAGLTFVACRRMHGESSSPKYAALAAGLVTVDPILLQQSRLIMTETIAAAAAAAIVAIAAIATIRPAVAIAGGPESSHRFPSVSDVALGIVFAIAYLIRPTFLVWALLVIGVESLRGVVRRDREPLVRAACVGTCVMVAVGGWTLRNVRTLGHPVWATTHGGYTLLLANNPSFYDHLRTRSCLSRWDPTEFFVAYSHRFEADATAAKFWANDKFGSPPTSPTEIDEIDDDRICGAAARAVIGRQPAMFAWSCVARLMRLWSPLPLAGPIPIRLAVCAYYVALYMAVIVGGVRVGRRWRKPAWAVAAAGVFALSIVHAVYWSNLRMRAPAIPILAIVSTTMVSPTMVVRTIGAGTIGATVPRRDT